MTTRNQPASNNNRERVGPAGTRQREHLNRLTRVMRSATVVVGLAATLGFSALAVRQSQATGAAGSQSEDESTVTQSQPAAQQSASSLPSQSLFSGEGFQSNDESTQPSSTTGSQAPAAPATRHRTRSSSSH
jgi:hypothetical protein